MTKDAVGIIIKRFAQINYAIDQEQNRAAFYVGNRRYVIDITDDVRNICKIIEIVFEAESNLMIKQMIKGILSGENDVFIIQNVPYSKNAYYSRKQAIMEKIYDCCISWGIVSFEDILNEEIA